MKKELPHHPYQDLIRLRDLVYVNAERWGDKPLYIYVENKEKHIYTYNDHKRVFNAIGTALSKLGLFEKTVSLVGDQHPDWIDAYLSVICAGGVIVPLDRELKPDQLCGFIRTTDSEALFCTEREFRTVYPALDTLPALRYIILIGEEPDRSGMPEDERILYFDDLVAEGEKMLEEGDRSFLDFERDSNSLAAILFTSGTTGTSKGVMLSEYNIVFSVVQCCKMVISNENDVFVSVLPIHHTFALTTNHLAMSNIGATAFLNDSLRHTFKNITEVKPTALILVPLFIETMHKKIWDSIRKNGKEKQVRALMKMSDAMRKTGVDMRRRLFGQIIGAFGGNLKYMIVGGAPLDPNLVRDFDSFGIEIYEGYGITECCPLISVNPYNWRKIGSVGYVAYGMEARIEAEEGETEGEIVVSGGNVFLGYYKNEEATREAFTDDGWFKTGDIGHIDKDKFVYITGRKKNVIIASNGKNVYPEELEEYAHKIPYIKEIVVIGRNGENGTVITALVYPDRDNYPDYSNEVFYEKIFSHINDINKGLPSFKHITALEIRDNEFEKTTTKKIKRFLLK
ncbi:MAG: AMP-binding protein [Clostridia bacterium]|nr:AMP-binding protein [Clostridia bacterium]